MSTQTEYVSCFEWDRPNEGLYGPADIRLIFARSKDGKLIGDCVRITARTDFAFYMSILQLEEQRFQTMQLQDIQQRLRDQ